MKKLLICVVCLCALLGYTNISYGTEQDEFQRTFELAQNGDAEAQYIIGLMYKDGKGVQKDIKKAAEWFEKAAAQGNADSQNHIGIMYYLGYGVQKDIKKAIEWFEKAAVQGHSNAQFNLGVMYVLGHGVRQNISMAKEWFGKACDNGLEKGCENYAKLNEAGY